MRGYFTFLKALRQKKNALIYFLVSALLVLGLMSFVTRARDVAKKAPVATDVENVDLHLGHVTRWTSTVELERYLFSYEILNFYSPINIAI